MTLQQQGLKQLYTKMLSFLLTAYDWRGDIFLLEILDTPDLHIKELNVRLEVVDTKEPVECYMELQKTLESWILSHCAQSVVEDFDGETGRNEGLGGCCG
jgi:hypothetical protein